MWLKLQLRNINTKYQKHPIDVYSSTTAERANRTLGEGVTTLLAESGLPDRFWGEAIATLVHVRNRTALTRGNITPYELAH